MLQIIILVAVSAAAFVAGVLIGRNNKAKVEAVVSEAKALEGKVMSAVKK